MHKSLISVSVLFMLLIFGCGANYPYPFSDSSTDKDIGADTGTPLEDTSTVDLRPPDQGTEKPDEGIALDTGTDMNISKDALQDADSSQNYDISVVDDSGSSSDTAATNDLGIKTDSGGNNELRLYKSGTRIKAKVLKTADGAQAFMGWYDTELEMDCSFSPFFRAEDGKIRCIPSVYPNATSLFADSVCSKPLWYISSNKDCTSNLDWLAQLSPAPAQNCSGYWLVVYHGATEYKGSKGFTKQPDGTCVDNPSNFEIYNKYQLLDSLGEKQPPEIFAEATISIID